MFDLFICPNIYVDTLIFNYYIYNNISRISDFTIKNNKLSKFTFIIIQ